MSLIVFIQDVITIRWQSVALETAPERQRAHDERDEGEVECARRDAKEVGGVGEPGGRDRDEEEGGLHAEEPGLGRDGRGEITVASVDTMYQAALPHVFGEDDPRPRDEQKQWRSAVLHISLSFSEEPKLPPWLSILTYSLYATAGNELRLVESAGDTWRKGNLGA